MSFQNIGTGQKISFSNLCVGDTLLLQTLNSTYEFMFTDLVARKGSLCGGSFGKIAVSAVLIDPYELYVGAQIRFQLESTSKYIYMTTTAITYLEVVKKSEISALSMFPTAKLKNSAVYAY